MCSTEEEALRVADEPSRRSIPHRAPNLSVDFAERLISDDDDEEDFGSKPEAKPLKEDEKKEKFDQGDTQGGVNGAEQVNSSDGMPRVVYISRKRRFKHEVVFKVPVKIKRPRKVVVADGVKDIPEELQSKMCHQCQRNDSGEVVRCQNCKRKRYCHKCLQTWYPRIGHEDIAKKCPFCWNTCNCGACLRLDTKMNALNSHFYVSKDEQIQCSKYILRKLLPHLKEINDEQNFEKEAEAKILDWNGFS